MVVSHSNSSHTYFSLRNNIHFSTVSDYILVNPIKYYYHDVYITYEQCNFATDIL